MLNNPALLATRAVLNATLTGCEVHRTGGTLWTGRAKSNKLSRACAFAVLLLIANPTIGVAMDQTFQSSGVAIRYTDDGDGAPVLLIHGYTGTADMWVETGTTAMLTEHFRVIAVDCRGHGQSGKPDGAAYGLEMVEDLARLLDALDISEVAVVGYSMGAEIGLRLAVEDPNRVRSIVIGGSGWSGEADANNYKKLASSLEEEASFGPMARAMTQAGQPEPTAEDIEAMDQMLQGQDVPALIGVARGMAEIVNLSTDEVSAIAVPVLGITGEHDAERGNVEKLKGAIPDYTLIVLPGRDHMSAMSDPQFNDTMLEFLSAG